MKRGLHREKKKKINVLSLLGILSLQHRIQRDFLSRGFLEMAGKTCNPSTPCSHTHLFDLTQHLPLQLLSCGEQIPSSLLPLFLAWY